jgi:hypothetical protein
VIATSLIFLLLVMGCAESTHIRTSPPSARVYVDGQFVGVSPTIFTAPRSEFQQARVCRAELDGYAPAEEPMRTGFSVGRFTGALFTLGIVYLFKSPYVFRGRHDLVLTKLPSQAAGAAGAAPAAAGAVTAEDRLRRIKQLRQQGVITQEEYDRHELEILRAR